ncbi:MAG TPA: DUF3857 domain-containing protein [Opitutaceae bacterium]|nr:DUF3857 domain-containing protein [Opitutaceae bacterium]
MPASFRKLACVVLGLVGILAHAAVQTDVDPKSLIAPQLPGWIRAPLPLPPPPPPATSSAVRMLVVERQINVATAEAFHHVAVRIESEAGLQEMGQVALTYASLYQQFHWHYLRIWRNGRAREMLTPDSLQVLRQEQDAERFVYHGWLSPVVILHDVRVGDIIEYAYTVTGDNPVFDGKFSVMLPAGFSVPVDRLSYRILCPANRPLHVRLTGNPGAALHEQTDGGTTEYRWTGASLPAVRPLRDAPGSTLQYPFVSVSEFNDWRDIAAWGCRLFDVHPASTADLDRQIEEITRGCTTTAEKANVLLQFVQDEIRYLGIELGESSHRPSPPAEVLQQRFGDCKDKSLLLVTMLRRLGLQADVALVNSTWHETVEGLLPSPLDFDHVIVRVVLPVPTKPTIFQPVGTGLLQSTQALARARLFPEPAAPPGDANPLADLPTEKVLWLDPTRSLQGGPFDGRFRDNFGVALVLTSRTTELQAVPPVSVKNGVWVRETYVTPDYEHPAKLQVVTTYRGELADLYRYYRRYSDPARQTQQLTGVLAKFYPKITSRGTIAWKDNRAADELTATSNFEVPDFWRTDAGGRQRIATTDAWELVERLPRPETIQRTVPYALPYPMTISHEIVISPPKGWPIAAQHKEIGDHTFNFTFEATGGSVVVLRYVWQTTRDQVAASEVPAWTKRMADVRATFGYQLTQNIRLAAAMKATGWVWPLVAALVLGLGAGLVITRVLAKRRVPVVDAGEPPPLSAAEPLRGLGGWLILVGIGVTVRPLYLLMALGPSFRLAVNHPGWVALTDSESTHYLAGFAPLVCGEAFFNALLLVWSCVLVVQFYRKRSSFPRTLAAYLLTLVAWLTVHQIAMAYVNRNVPKMASATSDLRTVVGVWIMAAVWVPYLYNSRRVRVTFVE